MSLSVFVKTTEPVFSAFSTDTFVTLASVGSTGFPFWSVKPISAESINVPFAPSGKTVEISTGAESFTLFLNCFTLLGLVSGSFFSSVLEVVVVVVSLVVVILLVVVVSLDSDVANEIVVAFPSLINVIFFKSSLAKAKLKSIEACTFGKIVKAICVPLTSYVPISLPAVSFNVALSSFVKLFSGSIVTEKVVLSASLLTTSAEILISLLLSPTLAELIVKPLFSYVTAPTCAIGAK